MHLSIEKVYRLAEQVGGKDHHFKYVQAPINAMMPEAFVEPWQSLTDAKTQAVHKKMLLAVCSEL